MSLFEELKRRNVFRVGIAYLVGAWLLLQLTEVLTELLELSTDIGKIVIVLLIVGFIPALIFAWAFEMTPDGIKREKDIDRSQSITTQTGRKLNHLIIGVLVVAVSLLLADKFLLRSSTTTPEEVPVAAEVADTNSVAVLPFVDMSPAKDQEYFTDGLTENLLHALAQVRELKVAGRTSSFAFKDSDYRIPKIAALLGVGYLVGNNWDALLDIADVPFDGDVDLDRLAAVTEGLSFADLSGLLREAALVAEADNTTARSALAAPGSGARR